MNIKQLEAFLLVAELRNFTKTAGQLGMSQPAVSFQIKALEEELGVTLLERNEKKVLLTEAGRLLYPEIKQMVRHYRKIRAMVNELQGLKSGHLMLGATSMPAECLLPIFIGGFREQYPGVRVSLQVGNSAAVARWLQDREIDIGVLGAAMGGESIEYHPWLEDELIFIVPSWHPWAGNNISLEELTRESLIIREAGSGTRQALEAKLAEHNINVEHFPSILELGSSQSMVQAVRAGLGIAAVSRRAAHDALEASKVARVIIPGMQIRYYLYLAWPRQVSNGLSAAIFKSFLMDRELCRRLLGETG
ncbi:selenium metabolism-associated LysR family transcriptional regulator [Desulfofundulus thermosubterraneus]|uniref:DNA-binding transcriptional regulator, LysR family n=1 Tax=Desulfofundulus thermosubterraneus DSM 16057 TaxID=1121432 RepID=A0A1M6EMM2_9FIRM|nr:selenium metabolism-associated LysR family transcriptional regulator [Desulfofundulus thermosubterraneus]SHI86490.1 DNA-binding transcriptional regulator, LysR family [Desulfofundulus thermosubterraneus DSM 16057]